MTFERIDKYLKETMVWNSIDLFYAYCNAKGIDDPECDVTEEEYTELENEFQEKVTYDFLRNLVYRACKDVNARFYNAF